MATCDSCRRRQTGSQYQFHYGTHISTTQSRYDQVTFTYKDIRAGGAAICAWCATRFLLWRHFLPFGFVIVLELAAYYRLSAGTLRLTETGVYIATVVVIVMLSLLGSGLWHGIAYTLLRRAQLVRRFLLAGLILALGTFGVLWPLIWWLNSAHTGDPVTEDLGSAAHWFIGVPVGAQLLLLLGLVTGRTALLETKAWRLKRKVVRGGKSVFRSNIVGWNSVQYSGLQPR